MSLRLGTIPECESNCSVVAMAIAVSDPIATRLTGMECLWVETVDGAADTLEGMNDLKLSVRLTRRH